MFCSTCGDERRFERPPCADGHGDDCPELVCTGCGTAVLMASGLPWTPGPAPVRTAPAAPAPVPFRAA